MGVYEQFTSLTTAEQAFIATHPQYTLLIRDSKDKAFSETSRVFGHNGHNDASDAFRHCFWSATLARDMGYVNAWTFTTAHESRDGNDPGEKAMDLHNNGVGLRIGRTFLGDVSRAAASPAGIVASWLFSDSDATVSTECQQAHKNGQLQIAP